MMVQRLKIDPISFQSVMDETKKVEYRKADKWYIKQNDIIEFYSMYDYQYLGEVIVTHSEKIILDKNKLREFYDKGRIDSETFAFLVDNYEHGQECIKLHVCPLR